MGREIRCMAEVADWTGEGRLMLESHELIFRGARKLTIPLTSIRSVRDENGWLVVEHGASRDRFDLGKLAPGWVNAIAHPRGRIDKLDVKESSRAALIGEFEEDFLDELYARTPHVNSDDAPLDLLFVRVSELADLDALGTLRQRIAQNGAIWLVHPRGRADLKHEAIVAAAKRAGLVDTKTARFSDTHTALKLVIPKAQRV